MLVALVLTKGYAYHSGRFRDKENVEFGGPLSTHLRLSALRIADAQQSNS